MGTIVARLGVDKIAKNAKFWRLITGLKNGGRYLTGAGVALTESGEFWESRICARQRFEERLREEVFWGAALGETAANQDPYAALLELVSTSPFFWSLPVEVVHPDYCLPGSDANSFLGRFQAEGADPRAIKQLSEAWNASLDSEIMAILKLWKPWRRCHPPWGSTIFPVVSQARNARDVWNWCSVHRCISLRGSFKANPIPATGIPGATPCI